MTAMSSGTLQTIYQSDLRYSNKKGFLNTVNAWTARLDLVRLVSRPNLSQRHERLRLNPGRDEVASVKQVEFHCSRSIEGS